MRPHSDQFTITQLRECAERQCRSMAQKYPGYIARKRYTADWAGRQIAMMECIAQWLEAEEQAELLV